MTRPGVVVAALLVLAGVPSILAGPAGGTGTSRSMLTVYLVRGEHVAPVRRFVAGAGIARAALAELLHGATAGELAGGYRSAIPTHVRVASVDVRRGVATIDLGRRFEAGGGSVSMQLRVAQVVYTATQFPGITRVAFRLDGASARAIGGEGVVVWPPVGRASFESSAPPILVEAPLPNDLVAAPIRVRGSANVFERQFLAELRSPAGLVLARREVHAVGSAARTRATFSLTLPVRARLRGGAVVVYDRSARDGRIVALVRIPVRIAAFPHRTGAAR